jgi:hypothetical protein
MKIYKIIANLKAIKNPNEIMTNFKLMLPQTKFYKIKYSNKTRQEKN